MLKNVWKFAGILRTNELALKELEEDLKTWIKFNTYPHQEMMAIFHERLLTIHPFRDGNGRWSRVLTEFICSRQGHEIPRWGSKTILEDKARREQYILAIKEARHQLNYEKLIGLMWS